MLGLLELRQSRCIPFRNQPADASRALNFVHPVLHQREDAVNRRGAERPRMILVLLVLQFDFHVTESDHVTGGFGFLR